MYTLVFGLSDAVVLDLPLWSVDRLAKSKNSFTAWRQSKEQEEMEKGGK